MLEEEEEKGRLTRRSIKERRRNMEGSEESNGRGGAMSKTVKRCWKVNEERMEERKSDEGEK